MEFVSVVGDLVPLIEVVSISLLNPRRLNHASTLFLAKLELDPVVLKLLLEKKRQLELKNFY